MAITLSQASFTGLVLETLVFGIFLLVFCVSMYLEWEIRNQSTTLGKKIALGFSILLLCLTSTHWFLNVWGCYEIYMDVPRGPLTEYAFLEVNEVKSMIRTCLYEIQVWIGDAILIYRLYYVCGQKVVNIIFPCVTCVAAVVCSSNFLRAVFVINLEVPKSINNIRVWCTATLTLTFVENCYCAGMIAFHIWRSQRDMRVASTGDLGAVLRIFIESAGLWIFFVFVNLISYVSKSNMFYVFLYLANPILGISFCMMTVRLNLLKRRQGQHSGNPSVRSTIGSHIVSMKESHPIITPFPYFASPTKGPGSSKSSFSEKTCGTPSGYNDAGIV